ncbi:Inner spore coat protein H [Slackia heliotrinireducens]|uniref:CotH protein n=1 Tax=Slackia heliotrinireducens (strain ATCC 29202 / DSM 20476 / NCTC 11029 / RHS 1) TaxID=471855 RepID=C7N7J9_SLAHD|nr:CotH kinase family protein [Slackia heliotrinireducens]ACV22884.1 CotH protein [Slackia heliotrinireducens DSM 20476]VEH01662.1 Inner spore coat protein H [Slackia heliotrinireducens]
MKESTLKLSSRQAFLLATAFLVVCLLVFTGCHSADKDEDGGAEASAYASLIFDGTRVHTVDIEMTEEDRTNQPSNPKEKTKYKVTAVIDGEEVEDVAFSTKGNSSLFFVADAGKDKFSYGIDFGKYVDGQTYHGLDKLNLQNNFTDGSAMKEHMAYWLFDRMGVDAPLTSYVWLTVNGEVQGLYTAVEGVEESFLERTQDGEGALYKPEDGDMALTDEEMKRIQNGESAAHNNGGGADLAYKDDNEESYPDIFENAETPDDAETRERIIMALKALSEGEELEQHLNTEEIIRYFAVHNFLVSYDSYTGPMLHNYLLYEKDGRLALLPWDYDIAFGSFPADAQVGQKIDSGAVVNAGIDSPLGIVPDEERPMWNWILSDERYLAEYHDALSDVTDIIDSGDFKAESERVHALIAPYIEEDPKAFFSPEKHDTAYQTLLMFTELRAESITKQLDGKLATRSDSQDDADKVDASDMSIEDMGSDRDLQ